ncbi:serine/threonine protein kinase [Streptomyces venezuelae]|uniref:Serine/threonine protein kinase n=1 Tax=Streptomyces venezuelae TaxID=54571 RepID=A0A5P2D5Y2_STRVZ|nr:PQQ-binding-like beta-propeller repeat protein [Streptomyces venezuelae]QES49488.1 serine/threonine protein kinase [Streptomyces venezuelae]
MQSLRAEQAGFPEYAGQYRLESVLGSGGMGVVHLAASASGLKLAVKVVHAEHAVDPEFRARFRQEIAAARRVSGAFTAPVVDADPDAERPWMATLFIDAPTLAERVRERLLAGPELARLGAGLAEALRDIHRAGVVHRDLKPSNVLMAADGAKVIDFGISRPYDSDLRTETGKLIGTPPFMAPEQFQRPREVGPAADVFAMGAVLVHAATGRGPFDSDSPYIVAYQVVHSEPDLTGLPAELAVIVGRCLAKDPAERPSADELIVALRAAAYPTSEDTRAFIPQPRRPAVAEEEVTHRRIPAAAAEAAGEPGAPSPGGLRLRRRTAVALAVTAGLLLTGGAVGGYLQFRTAGEPAGTVTTAGERPGPKTFPPWTAQLGPQQAANQAPACSWSDGALYCSGLGVAAARVDPADGSKRWTVAAAGKPGSTAQHTAPQYAGGLVLAVADGSGLLQALDPATGGQRWRKELPGGAKVVPAGAQVLIAAVDGSVTALDAATGAARWTKRVAGVGSLWWTGPDQDSPDQDSPDPARTGVYVATPGPDGTSTRVSAVDPADGRVLWQLTAPGSAGPAGVAGGGLYLPVTDVRSSTRSVLRIDLRTRAVREIPLTAPLVQAQAAVGTDRAVYLFGTSGTLVALGGQGEKWRLETGLSVASRPVFADGRVHLSAADGRLLAVDAATGRPAGQTDPRMGTGRNTYAGTRPAPVVAGGRVFATAPDGSVFAVPGADPAGW